MDYSWISTREFSFVNLHLSQRCYCHLSDISLLRIFTFNSALTNQAITLDTPVEGTNQEYELKLSPSMCVSFRQSTVFPALLAPPLTVLYPTATPLKVQPQVGQSIQERRTKKHTRNMGPSSIPARKSSFADLRLAQPEYLCICFFFDISLPCSSSLNSQHALISPTITPTAPKRERTLSAGISSNFTP